MVNKGISFEFFKLDENKSKEIVSGILNELDRSKNLDLSPDGLSRLTGVPNDVLLDDKLLDAIFKEIPEDKLKTIGSIKLHRQFCITMIPERLEGISVLYQNQDLMDGIKKAKEEAKNKPNPGGDNFFEDPEEEKEKQHSPREDNKLKNLDAIKGGGRGVGK